MKYYRSQQAGFTLVEMMVVVVILGILAAYAVPSFGKMLSDQATQKGAEDIATLFNEARAQAALNGKNFNILLGPDNVAVPNKRTFNVQFIDRNNRVVDMHVYTLEDKLQVFTNAPATPPLVPNVTVGGIVVLPSGRIVTSPDIPILVFRICDATFEGEDGYTVWINSNGIARAHPNRIRGIGDDTVSDRDCY